MASIMSVVWAAGKLGAACYEVETSELFVLPDIAESLPDFDILRGIYNQFKPKYIMVSSRQDERLIKVLKELCDYTEKSIGQDNVSLSSQAASSTSTPRSNNNGDAPSHSELESCCLIMLPGKMFAPDACKLRLQSQRLPGESASHSTAEHLIFITSLIPFTSEIMVRAAGSLLRFLDTQGIELFQIQLVQGHIPILDIKLCQMDDLVLVDDTAWNSLQIFSSDLHPAGKKQGGHSGSKEGLSIYSLLNRCASVQGSKFLKLSLLRPTRNLEVLKRRYDVIEFCCSAINVEFVKNSTACLKSIKSFPQLLFKLAILHASVKEWKELYQSIYHCMLLTEIVSCQPLGVELFADIRDAERTSVLKSIVRELMRIVDFDESNIHNRFVPKNGIDLELDKKRQQYSCLPKIMALVAAEEIRNLPDYVQQCSIVYIPEVGYLLAVNYWKDQITNEETRLPGFDYKFSSEKIAYYKSQRTKEMDIVLGDYQVAILDMETSIMVHLTESILMHKAALLKIGSLASELDSLLSMAAVAREKNFVRPMIIEGGGDLEILEGRHPLVDMVADFVCNSTEFEGDERIVILTGPNASGKSVYLKQVGIIVLMALSGSFVPATKAVIPAFDRICTRIHARESVTFGLSTFLMDINQISLALRASRKNSLVIIDEFGKGTAEADGLSLLVATIENFIERKEDCPTVFLSTHFYSLLEYLQVDGYLKLQTMEFTQEGNSIVYLFKLLNGTCASSFAHLVATKAGISESIIQRSVEMEHVVNQQLGEDLIRPLPPKDKEDVMIRIADEFLLLNLDEVDCVAYLSRIKGIMEPFLEVPEVLTPPEIPNDTDNISNETRERANSDETPEKVSDDVPDDTSNQSSSVIQDEHSDENSMEISDESQSSLSSL